MGSRTIDRLAMSSSSRSSGSATSALPGTGAKIRVPCAKTSGTSSRERGCARDDYGKGRSIFSRATENGPAFCECFVCTDKDTATCRPSSRIPCSFPRPPPPTHTRALLGGCDAAAHRAALIAKKPPEPMPITPPSEFITSPPPLQHETVAAAAAQSVGGHTRAHVCVHVRQTRADLIMYASLPSDTTSVASSLRRNLSVRQSRASLRGCSQSAGRPEGVAAAAAAGAVAGKRAAVATAARRRRWGSGAGAYVVAARVSWPGYSSSLDSSRSNSVRASEVPPCSRGRPSGQQGGGYG